MIDHLGFLLLGLGNGAVYAAIGLALVVTHRSSGVLNLATGSIALVGAHLYAGLLAGQLVLLVPGLPRHLTVASGFPMAVAAAVAVLGAAVVALAMYGAVFRPLRSAPPVARAVASLGLMIVLQVTVAQRMGTNAIAVPALFPDSAVEVGGVRVPVDRLWFAAVVVAVAMALGALSRWTRFGLATRAVADSERGAVVTGLSPERIAAGNWAISGAVAGLAGVLIAPVAPILPISYTLFVVPGLAAALMGGFSAVLPAVVGGLAIGAVQSELQFLQARIDWMPRAGVQELVPLVLIFVVLLVRTRALSARGVVFRSPLGYAPRPRRPGRAAIVGVVVGVAAVLVTDGSLRAGLVASMIIALLALGQVVVTGFAGQISLAQLTLAGSGAFALSRLADGLGIPFPFAPMLAAVLAAVLGVVLGLPTLRARGLSVAVVTLASAVALDAFWFRNPQLNGGIAGSPVPDARVLGLDLGVGSGAAYPRPAFALLCLVVVVAAGFAVARLRTSRLGTAMLAVRANERAAAAVGIDVARTKLMAFGIAGLLAGLSGALLAYERTSVSATPFSPLAGLSFFAVAYVAGVTSVTGALLAGTLATGGVLYVLADGIGDAGPWYPAIVGAALVATVVASPDGLAAPLIRTAQRLVRRVRARQSTPGGRRPSPVAPLSVRVEHGRPTDDDRLRALPVLDVRGATVVHGAIQALDRVDVEVLPGEVVGLIGPNGAGKSSLLDAVSGFADASGEVTVLGRRLDGAPPHRRARAGVARTFQDGQLYDDLTVRDNVFAGAVGVGAPDVDAVLGRLGMADDADRPVAELSAGRRQLVSVARALAGRPSVLLLDEPAGGLDTSESIWLGGHLRQLANDGLGILLVEHDMGLVMGLCDRVVVLDVGRVVASGTPDEVQRSAAVAEAYLGVVPGAPGGAA